ncbi:NET1-associated nuclear protein 1, partial [Linderina macrospora]
MAKKAATKAEKVAKEVVKRARSTKQTDEPSHQSTPSEAFRAIELKSVSGGILTHEPVVFSQDSSQFYLSKDSAVAVYNVQNGEMVQNFSGGAQAEKVLAIFADADNHVYTFSADERVRLWDADTGALVKEWEVPGKIRHVVRDPKLERGFLAVIVRPKYTDAQNNTVKARAMVVRVRLEEDGRVEVEDLVQATSGANRIAVHPEGQWVAVYSNFKVQLLQLSANRVVSHKWAMGERISDIAFHPSEPVLAVGDWRGRIMFWYCLDDSLREDTEERDIVRRPYHWHAHKVNTIAFTEAGTSMLSGGEEGVVVFWQLATDHKSFLPRLGAEIVSIVVSPDQMYYSVTLKDNTVRIYSALDRALVSTLQGLKFAERAALANVKREHAAIVQRLEDDPFTSGLVVHPSTHHLVLNGEPGFLQVFNHLTDRHVSSIEVASFNRIGGANSAIRSVQPHVDLVQFSSDGAWMATVDSRCSNAAYGPRHVTESYLKFWRLDPSTQQYKLVTRVDNPHTHGVRAIAFQPMLRRSGQQPGLLCVSTGRDAMFRVWELQTLENAEEMWTCRAYAKYRGQQPRGCAFSCDGSILAVTFGGAVTLWDAHTVTAPVGTLMARAASPNLSGVAFIGQTNFLASWSEDRVDVWNMLTGSLWWTQVAPVMSVFVHARHALLAMAV